MFCMYSLPRARKTTKATKKPGSENKESLHGKVIYSMNSSRSVMKVQIFKKLWQSYL